MGESPEPLERLDLRRLGVRKRMVEGRAVERHSLDTSEQHTRREPDMLHEPETAHMKDGVCVCGGGVSG